MEDLADAICVNKWKSNATKPSIEQLSAKRTILYEMKQSRFILRGYSYVDIRCINFSIVTQQQTLRQFPFQSHSLVFRCGV